ncbi:hypothetical protein PLICRDRAFT_134252 [Plicaturopsis crispa FD-325 SS-3]|nr:hypothetical protein PLICRDRAFT_134252 [Plicaturopsis crispa FD-325 SS-3]
MASADTSSHIDALLSLINSAAQQAVAEFQKGGHGVPTLDHAHPNDTMVDTLPMRKAIQILEGACEQLCSTLAQPAHTLVNRSMAHFETACLRVVVQNRVPDILLRAPDGMPVAELSKESGVESHKLARIMCLLATKHCFREVAPNVFANTRLSRTLTQDKYPNFVDLMASEPCLSSSNLQEVISDEKYGPSFEPSHSAYAQACNKDKPSGIELFPWYETHPERSEVFNRGMLDQSFVNMSSMIITEYPWKDFPAGTKICDVGGGVGSFQLELVKSRPDFKLTIQDLPHVLDLAQKLWTVECPQAIQENRISFVPVDFFKESPVAGQDIYYLRNICHDWPDRESLKILRGIRKVMTKDTRLLIQEIVLPSLYQDETHTFTEKAPFPLLPNYGAGRIRNYNMDINLLCTFNGQERKLEEWLALTTEAGFVLRKAWDLCEVGLMEFVIAEEN